MSSIIRVLKTQRPLTVSEIDMNRWERQGLKKFDYYGNEITYAKSDDQAIDNYEFLHKNLNKQIEDKYYTKMARALSNCRTINELLLFFNERKFSRSKMQQQGIKLYDGFNY